MYALATCIRAVSVRGSLAAARRHRLLATASARDSSNASSAAPPADSADSGQQQQPPEESAGDAALVRRCEELQATVDQLQDKYKRALAESENTRRRLTKQAEEARVFGIASFCKDLLEVADVLTKANEAAPKAAADPALVEGLRMTQAQLQQVFRRHKLDPIDPAPGEKFDPNHHEALFEVPAAEGRQPGTVALVTKVGYRLQDRTLRPALVGVVKYT